MRAILRFAALALCLMHSCSGTRGCPKPAAAATPAQQQPGTFTPGELVREGHRFFGTVSRGLAQIVETAVSRWGQPNGYVLGQEGSGAFMVGLRYGDGKLYTKNAGDRRVFWEGPSVGFDTGGEGARTMMLVYNLPATEAIYQRFARHRRLCLFHRRLWHDGARVREHYRGADPLRGRFAAGRQYRLSQIYAAGDVESVLIAATFTTFLRKRCGNALARDAASCFRLV